MCIATDDPRLKRIRRFDRYTAAVIKTRYNGNHVVRLHDTSRLVGLVTLGNYCRTGRSTLVRGVDFTVQRSSPYRQHLRFTDAGVARLLARDYKCIRVGKHLGPQIVFKGKPAPLESLSDRERRVRIVTMSLMPFTSVSSSMAARWRAALHDSFCAPRPSGRVHRGGLSLEEATGPAMGGTALVPLVTRDLAPNPCIFYPRPGVLSSLGRL